MKRESLSHIRCPLCRGPLDLHVDQEESAEIVSGHLHCGQCGEAYPIVAKMANLLAMEHLEEHKRREMQGWIDLWKKLGQYEVPALENSFKLPYVGGTWTNVARMFENAMVEMQLTGQERILDVGAGQGWASKYFAQKGCTVFATDIVADDWFGLGRAYAIMDEAHVRFEPMLADGEKMPFPDDHFDYVFFQGALHHFSDFHPVLVEVYRILKPGGRIIAAGEPSIAIFGSEARAQADLEESRMGIIERRPSPLEYHRALRRAGFQQVHLDTYETYRTEALHVYTWVLNVRQILSRTVRPLLRPVMWLGLSAMFLMPPRIAGKVTLYINGGDVLIRGKKPA